MDLDAVNTLNKMSSFNKYKTLHGFPVEGQKIQYTTPTEHHWFTNIIEDEKNLLKLGEEYTVQHIELNSSSTYVWLEEWNTMEDRHDNPFFNMSAFTWEKPSLNPDDLVGFEVMDMGTVHRNYGYGIEVNGKTFLNMVGDPVIVLEVDKEAWVTSRRVPITKAYWKL